MLYKEHLIRINTVGLNVNIMHFDPTVFILIKLHYTDFPSKYK